MAKAKFSASLADLATAGICQHDRERMRIEAIAKQRGLTVTELQREMLVVAKREAFKAKRRAMERAGLKKPGVNKPQSAPEIIERVEPREPVHGVSKWSVVDKAKPHGYAKRGYVAIGGYTGKNK